MNGPKPGVLDHVVEQDEDEATVRLDLPRHIIAVGAPVRGLVRLNHRQMPSVLARMTRKRFMTVFGQVARSVWKAGSVDE